MAIEALSEASAALERASQESDGEPADRLRNQATQLAELAERDAGPDHGRIARHQQILRSLADEVGDEAAERVRTAIDALSAYRETVPGV